MSCIVPNNLLVCILFNSCLFDPKSFRICSFEIFSFWLKKSGRQLEKHSLVIELEAKEFSSELCSINYSRHCCWM